MSVVLACDLGGSSFRAALVDADGAVMAESVVVAPMAAERDGGSEIDPQDWWSCLVRTAAELAEQAPALFGQVQAIAICGITRTQIFLEGQNRSLRPAMTWKDARAGEAVSALLASVDPSHPERAQLNIFHPLARLAWLKRHEPAHFGALACVLEPKDYLNLRLTGRRATDPISSARLIASAGLLPLLDRSATLLPPVIEPTARVGTVLGGLAQPLDRLAGIPVFCCANDTWAAVLGLGALQPGFAYNISGTTEVFGVMGTAPVPAEGLLTVDWCGLYQLGGPSQNGADTVNWLLSLCGDNGTREPVALQLDRLLSGERHQQPLLFLPYLQGERVPYWDPNLRGAFIGLGRAHGATDLAWAVLEGVAFLNRVVLERAEAATGDEVKEIRFGGGAAANPIWRQVKADILGRPVVSCASAEVGILGAAAVAWTGIGHFVSLGQAQQRLVRLAARHEPVPARTSLYDGMFRLFRQAETALAPISHALSALTGPASTPSAPRTENKGTDADA